MGLYTTMGGGSIFFQNTKVTCILLYNKGGGGSRRDPNHNSILVCTNVHTCMYICHLAPPPPPPGDKNKKDVNPLEQIWKLVLSNAKEGFSFFEIQTPLENLTPHKQKGPPESSKFWTPLYFSNSNWPTLPPHHLMGGGGSELGSDRTCISHRYRNHLWNPVPVPGSVTGLESVPGSVTYTRICHRNWYRN